MARPTVAAGFPRAFLDFAVSRGADRQALLERSQINVADLQNQDNRIPLASYLALLEAGVELSGEPALSLLFGEAVCTPDISIVGRIGQLFGSVDDWRRQMNRYGRLMLDTDEGDTVDRFEFVPDNGNTWLKFTSTLYVDNPLLTESAFARSSCGTRAMLSSTPEFAKFAVPKAVHFTHKEPSYRAEYDRIFAAPLVFESHMNAFLIDDAFLKMQRPRTDPYLAEILSAHAEELLEKLEGSTSIRSQVERLLIPALHTREANIDTVAGQLALSRQTLFRKLKSEGVTFKTVLDDLRRTMALRYLNGQHVSVNETAYLVGFSEPAAFSRAFKRWTGSSPSTLRVERHET